MFVLRKIVQISKKLKIVLLILTVVILVLVGALTIFARNGSFTSFADEITQVVTSAVTDKITVTVTIVGFDNKPITDTSALVQAIGELFSANKNINTKGEAFFSLVPGKYSFNFLYPNCGASSGEINISSNNSKVKVTSSCRGGENTPPLTTPPITLNQKYGIRGQVTDSSSRAKVFGATVSIKSISISQQATTNGNIYNYLFNNLTDKEFSITVTHPNYETQTKQVVASNFNQTINSNLFAETNFQLKKITNINPSPISLDSNYNLPGDPITDQTTFSLYLSLKDDQNKWISHSEKIGANVTHSTDTSIKRSGQLMPVQSWPNANIPYKGENMKGNLTVLEIPITTKTGDYQIRLNKLTGSNTDFNMPDLPITFTKNDIKILSDVSGKKYAYFYYRCLLTKTETFEVAGRIIESDSDILISGAKVNLVCDDEKKGETVSLTAEESSDHIYDGRLSNYYFNDIPLKHKKCIINISDYDKKKYDSPETVEFTVDDIINGVVTKDLTLRLIKDFIIAGAFVSSDSGKVIDNLEINLSCGGKTQSFISKDSWYELGFNDRYGAPQRVNYNFDGISDSGVSYCDLEIVTDKWYFPGGKKTLVVNLNVEDAQKISNDREIYLIIINSIAQKKYSETNKYFDIYGKVSFDDGDCNIPPGSKVSIKIVDGDMEKKISEVKQELFWLESIDKNKHIANYFIPDIPLYEDAEYLLRLQLGTYKNTTASVVSDDTFRFSSKDITNIKIGKSANSLQKNFTIKTDKVFSELNVSFRDAMTGQIVDLSKEKIIKNNLFCYDKDNNVQFCFKKSDISASDPSIIRYTYLHSYSQKSYVSVSQSIQFETENYWYGGGYLKYQGSNATTLYLISKTNKNQSIICKNIHGIDFCTYKAIEQEIFTAGSIKNLEKYAKFVTQMAEYIGMPVGNYPDIYLTSSGESRSYAGSVNTINIGNLDSTLYFALDNVDLDNPKRGIETVVHEFGHIADYYSKLNEQYYEKFNSALNAARGLNNDGTPILSSDGKPVNRCDNLFRKYRCFSNYALTTNSYELWAEFFTFWVIHNDQVAVALSDNEMIKTENSHCLNALKFLDGLMREKFPKMITFKSLDDNTTGGSVKGASTQNSDAEFLSMMRSLGYQEVPARNYDTIAKFADLTITATDIAKGRWLKTDYDKLPVTIKARMQLDILSNKVSNHVTTGATATVVKKYINQVNVWVENNIRLLGIKISSATIAGRVKDLGSAGFGSTEGLLIKIGNKTAVVDKNGNYSLKRAEFGELNISISNPKSGKEYKIISSKCIEIKKNKKYSSNIIIARPVYTLKGKIMNGDKPLASAQISFFNGNDKNVQKTAEDGSFSVALKDGEYSYKIFNNGRNLKVTNYGELKSNNKFMISEDKNVIIWVK